MRLSPLKKSPDKTLYQLSSLGRLTVSILCASLILWGSCTEVFAQLRQPDGSIIPATNNLANILNSVRLNEGINVIQDASLVPEVFTPSDVLTFSFVAEGGGYENAFGWYNLGDDVTNPSNRFIIFDCSVEPQFPYITSSVTFCGNPQWKGGPIGFFLITPERRDGRGRRFPNCAVNDNVGYIYYSEPRLNIDEDPNSAFIHHLVYRSNSFPNAFYFGFEDLFRGGDNDFEDTLVLVEGLLVGDAPELCDGLDDDCDGRIDEGAELSCSSVCGQGLQLCQAGVLSACTAPDPVEELCDAIDNDCDGRIDEGLSQICSNACGEGLEVCIVGEWSGCTAPSPNQERCNNVDEDCDGLIDEGLSISCINGCGVSGSRSCMAGSYGQCDAPLPVVESCDGADNDCDGLVDEQVLRVCENSCGFGVERCELGSFIACDAPNPIEESCDGADNDCDGLVDEGITRPCSSQCGGMGVESCLGGSWIGCTAVLPRPEACNLLDDDCDGQIDESLSQTCANACGQGTQLCSDGAWSACNAPLPQLETCDGRDEDCDGRIDEGVTQVCREDCGVGAQLCVNGAFLPCNVPPPQEEFCDDLDNDCDGLIDEGLERQCDSLCGAGTELCVSGSWVDCSAPSPREESCNALDDDCDGSIDEALIRSCDNPCGEGMSRCDLGRWSDCPALSATEESCDGEDNDCDGLSDEQVICPEPRAMCVRGRCATPCESGECSVGQECIEGVCLDLPCQSCRPFEFCEQDRCVDPCAALSCDEGSYCDQGECLEGDCYESGCASGKLCVEGQCVADDCDLISCGPNEGCLDGRCFETCSQGACLNDQRCVRGECIPDACAGISCGEGERCQGGACVPDLCEDVLCPIGRRCAEARCVDDPCTRVSCPSETECVFHEEGVTDCIPLRRDPNDLPSSGGEEISLQMGGEGATLDPLVGGSPQPEAEQVAESITGGCEQSVSPRKDALWLFSMLALLLLVRRSSTHPTQPLSLNTLFLWGITLFGGGCDEAEPTRDSGLAGESIYDPFTLNGCSPRIEQCNGKDDDCDGVIDNVSNLDRDPKNCGQCGLACDYPQGEGSCINSVCRLSQCEPGFVNLDGVSSNGCEATCEINPEIEAGVDICNLRDDDCDGVIDEGFNLGQDPANCGQCGLNCIARGVEAAICLSGRCVISACEEGYLNLDGSPLNGCEYQCEAAGAEELCNGIDDDCDGRVDESIVLTQTCSTEGLCAGAAPECRGEDGVVCRYPEEVSLDGEIRCDGRDEDCDGLVDEDFLGLGAPCDGEDEDLCLNGTITCSSDRTEVICQERISVSERCDGQDNDCDERIDEGFILLIDPLNCGRCGVQCATIHAESSCVEGRCLITQCEEGYLDLDGDPNNGCEYACQIGVNGSESQEICDGEDNDCDGRVDESLTIPIESRCLELGVCSGSSAICRGHEGFVCAYPSTYEEDETLCDNQDNDCDGLIDEAFPTLGSLCDGEDEDLCLGGVLRCDELSGGRSTLCSDDLVSIRERCDGIDNDCDGVSDEDFDLQGDPENCGRCGTNCALETATSECIEGRCEIIECALGRFNLNGVTLDGCEYECEFRLGGVESCNGVDDDCDGNVDEGVTPPVELSCDGPGVCRGVLPSCQGEEGFACILPAEVYQVTETRCDQLDNDCDGVVDEAGDQAALSNLGELCGGGVGACARQGVYVCTEDGNSTRCSSTEALPSPEVCNNIDDDCDGVVDEEVSRESEMVFVDSGGSPSFWIDRWEASRPDASANSIGLNVDRACSKAGVLPWANITFLEASQACIARGKRLCTDREWGVACGQSAYPYGESYDLNACNTDHGTAVPTGTANLCMSVWGAMDLSGNLAEWTSCAQAQDCQIVHPQLGGSFADRVIDLHRCDFRGNAVPTIATSTAGFRCCTDP